MGAQNGIARIIRATQDLVWDFATFGKGYARYLSRKVNDNIRAYHAMRRFFCLTNGRLNDTLSFLHRLMHRPYLVNTQQSLIEGLDQQYLRRIVTALDQDGYYIFEQLVPDAICKELTDFARNSKFTVTGEDGKELRLRFDAAHPAGVRYNADGQEMMENAAAQKLATDPGFLAIAQAYFRGKAVQDNTAMWWSVPAHRPNSKAAQLYHFDMDRIKFLKFFLYLTDVHKENGPHCYVAGSHRHLPRVLRKDKRHTDEEVYACYPPEKRIEITGPRGTLCAVDTRGLHKGKQLVRGYRLIFQVEFAINLFGMSDPPINLNDRFSAEFLARRKQYPYAFLNYIRGQVAYRVSRDLAVIGTDVTGRFP
jgi:hypothetical protein